MPSAPMLDQLQSCSTATPTTFTQCCTSLFSHSLTYILLNLGASIRLIDYMDYMKSMVQIKYYYICGFYK